MKVICAALLMIVIQSAQSAQKAQSELFMPIDDETIGFSILSIASPKVLDQESHVEDNKETSTIDYFEQEEGKQIKVHQLDTYEKHIKENVVVVLIGDDLIISKIIDQTDIHEIYSVVMEHTENKKSSVILANCRNVETTKITTTKKKITHHLKNRSVTMVHLGGRSTADVSGNGGPLRGALQKYFNAQQ